MPFFRTLFTLLILASLTVQIRAEIVELDNIVAIVNNDVITQLELTARFQDVITNLRQKNTKLPPANVLSKQVLDKMILERIALDMAERTGIKVDDTTLSRAITRIAAQNGMSLGEFRTGLAEQGIDYRKFQDDVKKQIILKRLLQRNVVNKITITDQEIDNFLFNMEKQGGLDQAYNISHILIATPEAASPAQIKKAHQQAKKVVEELRNGRDFAETAIAVSDGSNSLEGGELGWRKTEEIPSLFIDYVKKMKPGDVSDPIRSPSGFHIIIINEMRGVQQHVVTQTHARHILIKPDIIQSDDQIIIRLNQIRNRIINGEDFATMAKAHSEDKASATRGGDLGWFKPGTMVPEFEQALTELEPGEISEIVRTSFGYHIIELLGRRNHDDSDEMIRNKAREVLQAREIEEQTESFYRRIRDEAYVEILLEN